LIDHAMLAVAIIIPVIEYRHSLLQIEVSAIGTTSSSKKITTTPSKTSVLLGAFNNRKAPSSATYAATHTASTATRRKWCLMVVTPCRVSYTRPCFTLL
jgi:hypothetical protein